MSAQLDFLDALIGRRPIFPDQAFFRNLSEILRNFYSGVATVGYQVIQSTPICEVKILENKALLDAKLDLTLKTYS